MLEFLSDHLDLPRERILRAACIDPAEFDDTLAFEILGIALPQKHEDDQD
jgi:hypothetical protein